MGAPKTCPSFREDLDLGKGEEGVWDAEHPTALIGDTVWMPWCILVDGLCHVTVKSGRAASWWGTWQGLGLGGVPGRHGGGAVRIPWKQTLCLCCSLPFQCHVEGLARLLSGRVVGWPDHKGGETRSTLILLSYLAARRVLFKLGKLEQTDMIDNINFESWVQVYRPR